MSVIFEISTFKLVNFRHQEKHFFVELCNKSIITNNEFLSETVFPFRGLRQGCPLSLQLYVVQGKIATENINNNNTTKGIIIPN